MSQITRDLASVWHPCSQMKDYELFPPVLIKKAEGCYLETENGKKIIDASSSWWCKSLGHAHPRLKSALIKQIQSYEHVIGANTSQGVLVALSENLLKMMPHFDKVFYASEGSSAVEIAIKMSLHAQHLQGQIQRTKIMALQNGYHGETVLALSASDLGLYRKPYESLLLPIDFIKDIPYVHSNEDPLWHDCSRIWPVIEARLNLYADSLTAIILEPIVQAAAGMLIYSADFLRRLRAWTKKNQIHLIADEIMTGFGRTGTVLATDHAEINADFVCLGKALTAGFLPMSAVLTTNDIYECFYADYAEGKSFLHSHTFSGNALAASVALEALTIYQEERIFHRVQTQASILKSAMEKVARNTGYLKNIRHIGAVVAGDLITEKPRMGFKVMQKAINLGALLRPLGNTIYWVPPLIITPTIIEELQVITEQAINEACRD